ncbi:MAG: hypothetical protein LC799_05425 [Actinobacteria bacterium]|nr:hypothetical protein [Actinomycetota bacterium]
MSIDRSGCSPDGTSSAHGLRTYNQEHFWLKYFVADLWRTAQGAGLRPESPAPDFDLESTEGDRSRLADARGRPVLLHFGSDT